GCAPAAPEKPLQACPMDPCAIRSYRGSIDSALWHVERLGALGAQAGPLSRRIEQQPKGNALAGRRPLLFARLAVGRVKRAPIERPPIVSRPMRGTFKVAGSPILLVF